MKCKKWAYKTHKCPIMSLIPLTKGMRPVADALYDLGFELLSSSCFTTPVHESIYEHRITLEVELKRQYPMLVLGEIPVGWKYYTEVSGADWPISVLAYIETYVCTEYKTVEERIKQIVTEFADYLGTIDKAALCAIMMLID
jgi:hypothetical protein